MRLLLGVLLLVSLASATQEIETYYKYRKLCEHARYGEVCFYFDTRFATFSNAENVCRSYGGRLASILDPCENEIIARKAYILSQTTIQTRVFWVGGVYQRGWSWLDGQRVGYQQFANPNDQYNPPYSCLSIIGSSSWNVNGLWLSGSGRFAPADDSHP
uniref:C-type lectin domain-containing protein n=1 Tax=Steinernema glaseri TaxID=37863 RepID=A0A1I7XXM9_9BILA